MTWYKRIAAALPVAALCLAATGAKADTIRDARFTLAAATYWNDTLLEPGDYTITLERQYNGIDFITVSGEGVSAHFIATAGAVDNSGRSFLKLDDRQGTYVVREFDIGPLGKSYGFGVSKKVRNMSLSSEAATPVAVPIASGQ